MNVTRELTAELYGMAYRKGRWRNVLCF